MQSHYNSKNSHSHRCSVLVTGMGLNVVPQLQCKPQLVSGESNPCDPHQDLTERDYMCGP